MLSNITESNQLIYRLLVYLSSMLMVIANSLIIFFILIKKKQQIAVYKYFLLIFLNLFSSSTFLFIKSLYWRPFLTFSDVELCTSVFIKRMETYKYNSLAITLVYFFLI